MEPEVNIESLLSRIKREGVEEADRIAAGIIEKARSEAETIKGEARKEAEKLIAQAKEEVEKTQDAFETAMRQAGRNLVLSVKGEMTRLLDHFLQRRVGETLDPGLMKEIILKIIERWKPEEEAQQLESIVNEKDARELEELLYQALQEDFKKGIIIKPVDNIRAGFRIGQRDGHMHYDFTHEAIAEVLMEFLNPRIARFLEGASTKNRT